MAAFSFSLPWTRIHCDDLFPWSCGWMHSGVFAERIEWSSCWYLSICCLELKAVSFSIDALTLTFFHLLFILYSSFQLCWCLHHWAMSNPFYVELFFVTNITWWFQSTPLKYLRMDENLSEFFSSFQFWTPYLFFCLFLLNSVFSPIGGHHNFWILFFSLSWRILVFHRSVSLQAIKKDPQREFLLTLGAEILFLISSSISQWWCILY